MGRCEIVVFLALSGTSEIWAAKCPVGAASIYFGNGINTDIGHAVTSALNLGQAIRNRLNVTGNSISQSCLSFNLAPDFEFVNSTSQVIGWTDMALQLLDAGAQKGVELTPSLLWGWLNGVSPPPIWFANIVSDYVTNAVQIFQPDLQLHVKLYQAEINSGNQVIVVAHSQGNLYVNQAYIILGAQNSDLAVIAVATPASSVAGFGKWFTLYGDVITLVPTSLHANIGNDPPSPCLSGDSIGCHSFDNSYLAGDNTGPAILDATISAIPFSSPGPVGIAVAATLDGSAWPSSGTGAVSYIIAEPQGSLIGLGVPAVTPNLVSGQYKFAYQSGGPPGSSLAGIAPCSVPSAIPTTCDLTVSANQTFLFTLQFTSNPPTAGFTMSSGNQSATDGQTLNLTAPSGSPPTVSFNAASRSMAFNTNTIKNYTWTANGSILATTNPFSVTFPVGTSTTVALVVTDNRGISSTAATGTVSVTQQRPSGFSPTASMNEARFFHTATLLNDGTVLVTGGGIAGNPQIPSSSTAEIYVPSSGTWHYTAYPMNSGRTMHMAVELNDGRVLIAGGYNEAVLNTCEIYDPSTGRFTLTGSMNAGHSYLPMVLLNDGRVMVVEGNIAYYGSSTPPSEIYDPSSGIWSIAPSPAVGINFLSAVTLNNGNVLAITGYNGCCALNANVQLFNPATSVLTSMMPLIVGRFDETATTLLDGRVLVVAGTDWTQTINSTEIYDPSVLPNGSSQLGSPLNAARRAHTATLLPDGDVLVVAGIQAPNSQAITAYLSSAELWNHTSGVWSLAGSLPAGVEGHTATLLPSGAVLVTGGGNPSAVNTASIWNP